MKFDRKFWAGAAAGVTVYGFASAAMHMVGNAIAANEQRTALAQCYVAGETDGLQEALAAFKTKAPDLTKLQNARRDVRARQIVLSKTCADPK